MSILSANQGWFKINIESGPDFEVYSLKGREKINECYEFELELVSRDANVDLVGLIGLNALLKISDHAGAGRERLLHGSIRAARQLHTANAFTHYQIFIVPRLWYLGQNQDHRIFQNLSVPDIIQQILKENIFLPEAVSLKLKESYEPREYCVQYAESDLYFISRLCEEEGIYFYHKHKKDKHILTFSDASGGPSISGVSSLRFFSGSGHLTEDAVIKRLTLRHRINSDQASYREWNFDQPPLNLAVSQNEPDHKKAPAPGGLDLDTYQFPHLYQESSPGERYAEIQLKRQLTFSRWVEGEGDVARLLPGFAFTLFEHPRGDVNAQWWLMEVEHFGEQPQVLEHEAPDRGFFYQSRFTAIPFETRFVPEIKHPKKRVEGLQSAIVTGPDGEEVYVDKYGRVKVHFHWDRLGPMTEKSTCWVRVADGWAGQNFGFIQAPRIGQEVIVEFMEGNPDRPVITGRAYNAKKMPPWELPSQRVLAGIQSREFFGDQRNQMVFDDTNGRVQTQFASDHALSQLNLGHLTRLKHHEGRDDFRGQGFELRTDAWGAIRAAKGLFISTDSRHRADSYHKDLAEALEQVALSAENHNSQARLAAHHNAQTDEPQEVENDLTRQVKEIKGSGKQGELAAPHIVFSSPAGVALSTPESSHLSAGKTLALTARNNITTATGKSLAVSAINRVSLFAHQAGMKLFAGQGKMEIQAQSDALELIADQVMKIISAKEKVHIFAAEEVLLTAGGSYIKIDASGVESGTDGQFSIYAASHNFLGPKSIANVKVSMPTASIPLPEADLHEEFFQLVDENKEPIKGLYYKLVSPDGTIEGRTDDEGRTAKVKTIDSQPVELFTGRLYAQNEFSNSTTDAVYVNNFEDTAAASDEEKKQQGLDEIRRQLAEGDQYDKTNDQLEEIKKSLNEEKSAKTDTVGDTGGAGDSVDGNDNKKSGNVSDHSPAKTEDKRGDSTTKTDAGAGKVVCAPGRLITAEEGSRIVTEAASWKGTIYKKGGNEKGVGADCSGSTSKIYENAGFPYDHKDSSHFEDYALNNVKGKEKTPYPRFQEVTTPQEGDIVWWSGHLAIYHEFPQEKPYQLYYNKTSHYANVWTARDEGKFYGPGLTHWWGEKSMRWFRYYIWPTEEGCKEK